MLEDQKAAGPDGKSVAETSQKLVIIGVARPSAVHDVPEAPASAHSAKEWNRFHREELVMTVSNAAFFQISLYARTHPSRPVDEGAEHRPAREGLDADRAVAGAEIEETTGPNFSREKPKHCLAHLSR